LEKVTDEAYYVTGYTSKGDSGARLQEAYGKYEDCPTMTGAAIVTRILCVGEAEAHRIFEYENAGARAMVMKKLPRWSTKTVDMYYWYWGTLAMHKMGGEDLMKWEKALLGALLPNQKTTGCLAGSWDPVGAWGTAGGRVYATAVCALALETHYDHLLVYQKK
ncbi:MAG: hypothetical protein ACYTFG_01780, partial [Planctomycetota bacterium]